MSKKICLLTGAGRTNSIANGIAHELAADGWDLALTTWDGYDAAMPWGLAAVDMGSLVSELEAAGARVAVYPADLADPATPARLLDAVNDDLGPVTALVLSHSHGVDSSILDTTLESWDAHYAVNVRAAWLAIKAFAEQLPPVDLLDEGARIVALTSDHVVHNLPYGSSKGALDRLVVAAARELGHLGVSSNVLNPGPIDTGWMDDAIRASGIERQPTGRLGTPADIGRVVRFLLSSEGRWISGQLLKADGGFSV
ncbi:SDR family oxidoreductase [Frigoribacterium sp. CFBP 8759]|uniref:SDR family oxidoreductase n=1 Tax=Frigoribacterium sp. CFBP 8759 TaxID=2775283 RepID=UPI00177DB6BD|nr:SDR family oxidoreductase [Frigoribacterium sp. CFBP 8759]MBD8484613.1 SDR family oxidoreductase [Frigoribacterium sp. CFBP 8759]